MPPPWAAFRCTEEVKRFTGWSNAEIKKFSRLVKDHMFPHGRYRYVLDSIWTELAEDIKQEMAGAVAEMLPADLRQASQRTLISCLGWKHKIFRNNFRGQRGSTFNPEASAVDSSPERKGLETSEAQSMIGADASGSSLASAAGSTSQCIQTDPNWYAWSNVADVACMDPSLLTSDAPNFSNDLEGQLTQDVDDVFNQNSYQDWSFLPGASSNDQSAPPVTAACHPSSSATTDFHRMTVPYQQPSAEQPLPLLPPNLNARSFRRRTTADAADRRESGALASSPPTDSFIEGALPSHIQTPFSSLSSRSASGTSSLFQQSPLHNGGEGLQPSSRSRSHNQTWPRPTWSPCCQRQARRNNGNFCASSQLIHPELHTAKPRSIGPRLPPAESSSAVDTTIDVAPNRERFQSRGDLEHECARTTDLREAGGAPTFESPAAANMPDETSFESAQNVAMGNPLLDEPERSMRGACIQSLPYSDLVRRWPELKEFEGALQPALREGPGNVVVLMLMPGLAGNAVGRSTKHMTDVRGLGAGWDDRCEGNRARKKARTSQ